MERHLIEKKPTWWLLYTLGTALVGSIWLIETSVPSDAARLSLELAAVVGKTYAMLEGARAQRAAGLDVVAGVVETHRRAETEALLEGLEILPRRRIEYRGTTLEEFDLDAALTRHPALLLVDELAHTN